MAAGLPGLNSRTTTHVRRFDSDSEARQATFAGEMAGHLTDHKLTYGNAIGQLQRASTVLTL